MFHNAIRGEYNQRIEGTGEEGRHIPCVKYKRNDFTTEERN